VSEPTLFDTPIARSADPETSVVAAEKVQLKRGTDAFSALAYYRVYEKGLTDAQVEAYSAKRGIWKRCSDLRSKGLIVPTGEVLDGQRVCVITDAGKKALDR
jgi:hypothetical protein